VSRTLVLVLAAALVVTQRSSVRITAQTSSPYFSDDMEGNASKWVVQSGSQWAITSESSHSASHAWSDSPVANYANNENVSLITRPIDLRSASHPQLVFWHKLNIVGTTDCACVWVSLNNGLTYTLLRTFKGMTKPWAQTAIDLSPYAGQASVTLYFQLFSDAADSGDGWYIDDVTVSEGPPLRRTSDFNGDGRTDAGIFRPSVSPNGLWFSTPTGGGSPFQIYFGSNGDIPVVADYDGDGKADAVIWRQSTGLWYGPRTGAAEIVIQLILGQFGDIPVPCDYDGDGAIDPAFYRPSTGQWFGTRASGSPVVLNTNLGFMAGDIPAPADYNGDGRCDAAIMRPGVGPGGTNLWYSVPSGGGTPFQIYFGAAGDVPVPGDYDGDGKADAVIWRPSSGLWYGPRTGAAQIVIQLLLGQNGDIPVPGDYNGDYAMDPAVYTPSTGMFFGTNAGGAAVVLNTNFGVAPGDIPTGQRPHY
jgi:hypothetical protein